MNEYKVTFRNTKRNADETAYVTAKHESDAAHIFAAAHKGDKTYGDIWSVELWRENAPATKEQERAALAKIKALVEELGPESYLATAFEGCFEDAEQNIENDFALSMNGRWQHAEQQVEALKAQVADLTDKLSESEKDYEAAHAAAHEVAEQKDAEITALRALTLQADDLADISQLLADKVLGLGEEVSNAEKRIVAAAEQPEGAIFQNAVKDHRAADADLQHYTALLVRVNNIVSAGA